MTIRTPRGLTPVAALVLSLAACGGGAGGSSGTDYTLSVQKTGTGSGTVSGDGINCGATCSASLASGTAVTLTAAADAGSTFVGWSGCDTATGATCDVTMNAGRTVTATFDLAPVEYPLSVQKMGIGTGTVTGGAIDCGLACTTSLVSGTAVTLTALADPGSVFVAWTGCDVANGTTCELTMDASRNVTATFSLDVPIQYTLTVARTGAGAGSVSGHGIACGATCSASIAAGTPVTLTASPEIGSTFAGWLGCDGTTTTTCAVTMDSSRTVTATFDVVVPVRYTLSVTRTGTGSGAVTGGGIDCGATCSASFDSGTLVTLTASPNVGSIVAGWLGCDGTTATTCTVTMNATRGVAATFDLQGPGSLRVMNGTPGYAIAELYASAAGAGAWGANRLGAPIPPAGTFTLADLSVGTYDFRAVASDGISYWQRDGVAITAGGAVDWTILPPNLGSLSLVNNHCLAVDQLYVRPSSSPSWSPNQLAAPIDRLGSFTLIDVPVGTYDLTATGVDGVSWATNGVAVTAGGTFSWSLFMPAGTGCVTIINNTDIAVTSSTILFFFDPFAAPACSTRTDGWGTEQLAGLTIPPATSLTLSNVPQGAHDFRAIGVQPLGDPVDFRACGVSIQPGAIFPWYLIFPG